MFLENLDDFIWQSDWEGYEVGFPYVDIVGLYMKILESGEDFTIEFNSNSYMEFEGELYCYIDITNGKILEQWISLSEKYQGY